MEELFAMLAYPDDYECRWRNGELYIRCRSELSDTAPLDVTIVAALLLENGRSETVC
jgi:hypothetical protein